MLKNYYNTRCHLIFYAPNVIYGNIELERRHAGLHLHNYKKLFFVKRMELR